MEYIKLGNSYLNVSRICLGCMGSAPLTEGSISMPVGTTGVFAVQVGTLGSTLIRIR